MELPKKQRTFLGFTTETIISSGSCLRGSRMRYVEHGKNPARIAKFDH